MILSITQNGQLWSVRFPYDADVVTACKMLNGHWHATDKAWKFARAEDVDLLRGESVFATSGADLLQRVRARKIERAGFRIDPSLPLSPDGLSLLPFQVDAVKFIAQRESSLLAFPMGTGKSIISVATLNAAPDAKKVLIICPANLKSNWYAELKKWLRDDRTVGIVSGSYWPPTNIVIINYDVLDRHKDAIDDILWDICLIDESHYCKSPRAIRTKALIGGKKGQKIWQPIRAHRKIALSGTPLVNKPMEIWAVLNWLDPKNWPSSYWFGKKYAGGHQGPFGWVADGATNLEDLNRRLRSTVMLRKTKAELLPDLPPKYRQVIEFDLPSIGSIIREEKAAVESARAGVADLQAAVVMARVNKDEGEYREAVSRLKAYMRQAQSHIARARKNLAVAKVPYVVDHLRNALLDPEKKIIVFAHHRAVIESLFNQLAALGMQPVRLYGGMTQEDKNKAVETFQLDKNCRVFIGSITAAGVGLTLTAADHVVFAELDYVPGNMGQCEDRCIAEGQPILTPTGWRKVESIQIGDHVIGGDGRAHVVTDAWSSSSRKHRVEVRVGGWSEPLVTTFDHRYLVAGEWVEAANLIPGDIVSIPTHSERAGLERLYFPERLKLEAYKSRTGLDIHNGRTVYAPESIPLDRESLFVIGYFVGDGFASVRPGKGRFLSFAGHQVKDAGSHQRIEDWFAGFGMRPNVRIESDGLGMERRFYSAEWARWFEDMFGVGAYGKNLPEWVFDLNDEQIGWLLAGLCASDGYLRGSRQEYITVSEKLASQIMRLLWLTGRRAGLSRKTKEAFVVGWSLTPNRRVGKVLSVRRAFPKRIGDRCETVYDLTVEGCSSFVVGPAVVHNCHRIGQKSGVLVQHLVASGSLDAKIAKRLIEKQEILDAVLDGTSPLDALAPINWLLDHEEDADLSSAITEDALSRPVKPQEIAPAIYGLRSLVDRPRDFGVSDVDLILASRLVGRPLEGRPAAMARHLMKKYLDRS